MTGSATLITASIPPTTESEILGVVELFLNGSLVIGSLVVGLSVTMSAMEYSLGRMKEQSYVWEEREVHVPVAYL